MQLIDDKKKNCLDASSLRKAGVSAAGRTKVLRTMWDHMFDILRSDGLAGLYRGLGGTLLREV